MKSGRLFTGYKIQDNFLLDWDTPAVLESTLCGGDMPSVVAWLRRVADDLEDLYVLKKDEPLDTVVGTIGDTL